MHTKNSKCSTFSCFLCFSSYRSIVSEIIHIPIILYEYLYCLKYSYKTFKSFANLESKFISTPFQVLTLMQ